MKVKKQKTPNVSKVKKKPLKKKQGKKQQNSVENVVAGKPTWKKVKLAGKLLSDDGGIGLEGLLGLEVLENTNVLSVTKEKPAKSSKVKKQLEELEENSEDSDSGKLSKNARKKKKKLLKKKNEKVKEKNLPAETPGKFVLLKRNNDEPKNAKKPKSGKKQKENVKPVDNNENAISMDDLVHWNGFGIAEPILKVMAEKGFKEPTEIQALTFPAAIMGRRDILGAAETGSGKTLAFGIPIINGILEMKKSPNKHQYRKLSKKQQSKPKADEEANRKVNKQNGQTKVKARKHEDRDNWTPPPEEVNNFPDFPAASDDEDIVEEEHERDAEPLYALVLTPTRELAVQVKDHLVTAAKYTGIRVAAIFGGLAAVKQERVLSKCPEIIVATPGRLWELISEGNEHLNKLPNINFLVVDETDRMIEKGHFEELKLILQRINMDPEKKAQRQNFVFSATLTLMHELPQYLKVKNANRKRKFQPESTEKKLQSLIEYFGISQPKIVDITPKQLTGGTAQKLTECRISCAREHKDFYLYYFLQKHPGRTIVFCNSIDCVRRLTKLFTILQCEPKALHAKMAQRQRLKNLERFTNNPTGLLIATDVAARGLDIPNVEHVIHYQVPRTSENYIHRSGRTARGNKEGIAVLMMEPAEVKEYLKLCRTLNRSEDLPIFPVAESYLAAVRERVNLATKIDVEELRVRRKNLDIGWLKKSAKEMDILIDDQSDFSEDDLYDSDDGGGATFERTQEQRHLKQLQKNLQAMLAKPIFPKGICYKYPSAIDFNSNTEDLVKNEMGKGDELKDNAVSVMKKAIEEYKVEKKRRNKKVKPL